MNRTLIRLSTAVIALAIFVAAVSAIAARPWESDTKSTKADPRLAAVAAREKELQDRAKVVRETVKRRWHVYKERLKDRQREIRLAKKAYERRLKKAHAAAARLAAIRSASASAGGPPVVSVVHLAPVTQSKSS